MNKAELEKLLEEQAALQGNKPMISFNRDKIRNILNWLFLVIAFVGITTYFTYDSKLGFIAIGISLVIKVIEFLVRFLL